MRGGEREIGRGRRLIGGDGVVSRRQIVQDDERTVGNFRSEESTASVNQGGIPSGVMGIEVTEHKSVIVGLIEESGEVRAMLGLARRRLDRYKP